MGYETRSLMSKRLRRRHVGRRAFDVFIFVAFWSAVVYIVACS